MSKAEKKETQNYISEQNRIFDYILLIAFAVFLCIFTTNKIANDDDVFWHLATGKYIVQNFQIPSSDVFGYLTLGQKWIPFEWGWDSLTYIIYSIGGFYSLSIFRTIIILGLFSIIFIFLKSRGVNSNLILFFSVLLFFGILTRFSIRPQLVSNLFFVLLIYLLYNHKYRAENKKSILYILPIVFLIWANMHMGVLLGVLVFGIFNVSESIEFYKFSKNNQTNKDKVKYLLLAFLFSLIAMLINPHFIETYIYTFKHTQMDLLEQINEWKSPFSSAVSSFYYVRIYIFFLIFGIITIYYSLKNKNYFPVLIYTVIGIYSLQAMRFISDYMLIVFIPIMLSLGFITRNIKISKIVNSILVKIVLALGLILLIYNGIGENFYRKYLSSYFREIGFGENEKFFPKKMFDFIRTENIDKIGSRPFNNLKIGGYFVWNFPDSKNFIDSRNLNDSIYSLYKSIDLKKQGFDAAIEKLEIDYFIYSTPYLIYNVKEIERNVISYLSKDKEKWKLVYWDDRSFLFVKNIPKFQNIISKYEYKFLSPYNYFFERDLLTKGYNSDKAVYNSEIQRKLSSEPEGKIIKDMAEYFKRIN